MTASETYFISRDVWGVIDKDTGRELGTVKHNVVADGAIKWSAYDNLGQRLDPSYLTMDDAVRAVESTR